MIRIPKTGSTSVVRGLFGGLKQEDQVLRANVPDEWFEGYSFAFVRNPFTRLISAFKMFKQYRVENEQEEEFRSNLTIRSMLEMAVDDSILLDQQNFSSKLRRHCVPATNPFFHISRLQEIFRFEDYSSEYKRLANALGQPATDPPHFRKSKVADSDIRLTEQEIVLAKQVYQEDCATFGYEFNLG